LELPEQLPFDFVGDVFLLNRKVRDWHVREFEDSIDVAVSITTVFALMRWII
jgi:hypothetical protein